MKYLIQLFIIFLLVASCTPQKESGSNINELAIDYLKLTLEIAAHDPWFIDDYYGPDSLKFTGVILDTFPKENFLNRVSSLKLKLAEISSSPESSEEEKLRANWMSAQLTAYDRGIRIYSGEFGTFDEEAEDLIGVKVPSYDSTYFIEAIAELDSVLIGEGMFKERLETLISRFEIPEEKLDTCFKVAIEAARKITHERLDLPEDESITIGYERGKSWSLSMYYLGGYQSLANIVVDYKWDICELINAVCHDCYPGCHVYCVMQEKNLYAGKGWIEILDPWNPYGGPQTVIEGGLGVNAIDMAFPGESYNKFAKEVLMPLAGLDTTGANAYLLYNRLSRWKLRNAYIEAARGFVNGTMTEDEFIHWVKDFALRPKALNMVKNRTYVAHYICGRDLVNNYIEATVLFSEKDPKK
jgi:hypothetical protein